MSLAKRYVDGLKKAYYENGMREQWDAFERVVHGASQEEIEKLRTLYPDVPDRLVQLLEIVDGTYWREYDGEKVAFYFLGSDVEEYPYYMLSVEQMIEKRNLDWLADCIGIIREFGDEGENR